MNYLLATHSLHQARIWWSFIGIFGVAIAIFLATYAWQDRRHAIRGTTCSPGWWPRFFCVDRGNARDVQSWTALRRTVGDITVQVSMFSVRAYATTWKEPIDLTMIWQRWLGGWIITLILIYLAYLGVMDFVDRCRLVNRLRRGMIGHCPHCDSRIEEDYRFCHQCGTTLK